MVEQGRLLTTELRRKNVFGPLPAGTVTVRTRWQRRGGRRCILLRWLLRLVLTLGLQYRVLP